MLMKKTCLFLSIILICALVFSGCKSSSSDADNANEANNDTANSDTGIVLDSNNLPEAPAQYGHALHVKAGAEFLLYLNDRGGVVSYVPLNDAAKKIEDHININDTDCYNSVMDIVNVAIDDLDLDTKETDFKMTIVDSNLNTSESNEILSRATDAAETVLHDRGLEGVVAREKTKDNDDHPGNDDPNDGPDHPGNAGPNDDSDQHGPDGPDDNEHPEDPHQQLIESHPNFDKETGEFMFDSVTEIDDVVDFIRENHINAESVNINVSTDLSLTMDSVSAYDNVCLNMGGNSISVSGTVAFDEENFTPLVISNAGEADLSGLNIDSESFKNLKPAGPRPEETEEEAYWNTQRSLVDVVRVADTPKDKINISYPYSGSGPERNEKNFSIFEPYCEYEIRDDGAHLIVAGPLDEYDARKEKETKVVEHIFSNGEYHSLTNQTSNNFFYVCTDITLDIGDCWLPNMDYESICVGKGGHLKLTGTLYVTGGTFNIETYEYDGVDLTGLTVVKKHPSPDVITVRCDPKVGINEALCHCKAASGTIKFSKGSDRVAITIW